MALFQQSIRVLSQTAGRPISAQEAFECLNAELLAGAAFPDEKSWKKLRDQVDKDLEARRQQDQWPAPPSDQEPDVELKMEGDPEEVVEAPWEALAAVANNCPGAPSLQLVQSARPHWENDRLNFNQSSRQITPAQRKEILRRDGYRCSVPGCPHMLWLQVHHIVFYCEGGVTLPDNLVAVCSRYVTPELCDGARQSGSPKLANLESNTHSISISHGVPLGGGQIKGAASLPGAGKHL